LEIEIYRGTAKNWHRSSHHSRPQMCRCTCTIHTPWSLLCRLHRVYKVRSFGFVFEGPLSCIMG